ncbi:MAG: DUF1552 domain-containing protein [Planctomycetota bacterium]|nr:DUF1552 domain-containing protein [Planctomycetota bacterium]
MNDRLLTNRRDLLRAAGLGLTLPFLESVAGSEIRPPNRPPKRVIFIGYGYGHYDVDWYPTVTQPVEPFKLTPSLKGLESCKGDVSFVSNLTPTKARWAHDGCSTLLTCANTDADPSRAYSNSISVDQMIANAIGHQTRIASMQLNGVDGDVDGWGSGLSMSYDANGASIPGLSSLPTIYNRVFGDPKLTLAQRRQALLRKTSLVSLSNLGTASLNKAISREDKHRLEQFTESVHSLEERIEKEVAWTHKPLPQTSLKKVTDTLTETERIKATFDLMTEILRTDSTRVITYRLSSVGLLREMGNQQSTHSMSHWNRDPLDQKCQTDRDKKIAELFAYLINRLRSVKDHDGSTLLDNTLVFFGTGIRVFHTLKNIPMMVAGGGGIGLRRGQHFAYNEDVTPLGNLWVSVLHQFGIEAAQFGDSSGDLDEIFRS